LNNLEQLLALLDGIVVGVQKFNLDPKAACSFDRRSRLLHLIVVVVRGQRNHKPKFLHNDLAITQLSEPGSERLRVTHWQRAVEFT
jgi:hypothetical protein